MRITAGRTIAALITLAVAGIALALISESRREEAGKLANDLGERAPDAVKRAKAVASDVAAGVQDMDLPAHVRSVGERVASTARS